MEMERHAVIHRMDKLTLINISVNEVEALIKWCKTKLRFPIIRISWEFLKHIFTRIVAKLPCLNEIIIHGSHPSEGGVETIVNNRKHRWLSTSAFHTNLIVSIGKTTSRNNFSDCTFCLSLDFLAQ